MNDVRIWEILGGAVVAVEARGMKRHRGTASEYLARRYKTETRAGKWRFAASVVAGGAWLVWHINTFDYTTRAEQ